MRCGQHEAEGKRQKEGLTLGLADVALQQLSPKRRVPAMSERFLSGRHAVITGSTSGIGLAIAKAYAKAGASITLNGLGDKATIDAIIAAIGKEHGVAVRYSAANMLKTDEITAMIKDAEKEFGAVDLLVNNAGIQHVAPIDEFPMEQWDRIIAINLTSAFVAMRAAIPAMRAKGWGRIISTASAHSLTASPFKAAYVAAKHGIAGLTKTAALELATTGVTANAISPGYVWTPLVEAQIPDTMKARNMTKEQVIQEVMLERQPTKRFVTVEQVAGTALFLASDSAAEITGTNISIDGGWTAQ
jgi:3-hydroxybutyrate dehydrogenase